MTNSYLMPMVLVASLLAGCANQPYTREESWEQRINREYEEALVKAPSVVSAIRAEKPVICKGVKEAACQKKLFATSNARMNIVYFASNSDAVSAQCTAYPTQCTGPDQFELLALASHNEGLGRYRDYRLAQLAEARRAHANEETLRRQVFWQNMAAGLNNMRGASAPQLTECSTQMVGHIMSTRCR
jgi:hypothetical protein